jgi:hypothetical protein
MFSPFKLMFLIAFAVIAGYMLYDAFEGPEAMVVSHGKVVSRSEFSRKSVERPTRQMARGSVKYWQVKTPEGLWIDCAKDCAETYRREVLDYWEARKQEETGHGGK